MNIRDLITKYNITTEKVIIGLMLLLAIIAGLIFKKNPNTGIYYFLSNSYSDLLIFNTKIIFSLINPDITFDYAKNLIITNGKTIKINEFFYSLNQIAILFATILLTKSPYRSKIFYFLSGLLIYTLYNTFRISIHTIYPDTVYIKNPLFNLLLIPQWIILIALIYFYWQKYPAIIKLITNKYNISEQAYKGFVFKLIITTVIYYFVLMVFYSKSFFINGEHLVHSLLSSVNYVLKLLAYDSVLLGRTLSSPQAALYMDDSCVGINLMYLFAAFIFLMPGKAKDKFWFILSGVAAILIFNVVRIVLIYISIAANEGKYILPVDIHDIFTYPVLGLTLWMWTVWINKFVVNKK